MNHCKDHTLLSDDSVLSSRSPCPVMPTPPRSTLMVINTTRLNHRFPVLSEARTAVINLSQYWMLEIASTEKLTERHFHVLITKSHQVLAKLSKVLNLSNRISILFEEKGVSVLPCLLNATVPGRNDDVTFQSLVMGHPCWKIQISSTNRLNIKQCQYVIDAVQKVLRNSESLKTPTTPIYLQFSQNPVSDNSGISLPPNTNVVLFPSDINNSEDTCDSMCSTSKSSSSSSSPVNCNTRRKFNLEKFKYESQSPKLTIPTPVKSESNTSQVISSMNVEVHSAPVGTSSSCLNTFRCRRSSYNGDDGYKNIKLGNSLTNSHQDDIVRFASDNSAQQRTESWCLPKKVLILDLSDETNDQPPFEIDKSIESDASHVTKAQANCDEEMYGGESPPLF